MKQKQSADRLRKQLQFWNDNDILPVELEQQNELNTLLIIRNVVMNLEQYASNLDKYSVMMYALAEAFSHNMTVSDEWRPIIQNDVHIRASTVGVSADANDCSPDVQYYRDAIKHLMQYYMPMTVWNHLGRRLDHITSLTVTDKIYLQWCTDMIVVSGYTPNTMTDMKHCHAVNNAKRKARTLQNLMILEHTDRPSFVMDPTILAQQIQSMSLIDPDFDDRSSLSLSPSPPVSQAQSPSDFLSTSPSTSVSAYEADIDCNSNSDSSSDFGSLSPCSSFFYTPERLSPASVPESKTNTMNYQSHLYSQFTIPNNCLSGYIAAPIFKPASFVTITDDADTLYTSTLSNQINRLLEDDE